MIFRQITTFIKIHVTFVFGLQTLRLIDFSAIYQLIFLEPKNKGYTNFYECCDLMKNYINLPSPIHPLGLPPLTPQPSPKIGAEPGAEKGPFNFLPLLHLSYISSGSKVAFPGI